MRIGCLQRELQWSQETSSFLRQVGWSFVQLRDGGLGNSRTKLLQRFRISVSFGCFTCCQSQGKLVSSCDASKIICLSLWAYFGLTLVYSEDSGFTLNWWAKFFRSSFIMLKSQTVCSTMFQLPSLMDKSPQGTDDIPSKGSSCNLHLAGQKLLWEAAPRLENSNMVKCSFINSIFHIVICPW